MNPFREVNRSFKGSDRGREKDKVGTNDSKHWTLQLYR